MSYPTPLSHLSPAHCCSPLGPSDDRTALVHGKQILSMPVGMHVMEQQGIAPAGTEGNLALRDRQNHSDTFV